MNKSLLFLGLTLLLTSCSIQPNTPSSAVETALDAIESQDTWAFNGVSDSKLEDYILSDDNFLPDTSHMSEGQKNFYETLVPYIKSFDYTIDDVIMDNTTANVVVTITNYDIATCLTDIQDDVITQFESLGSTNINDYCDITTSLFEQTIENYFYHTHTITMTCIQQDQQWSVHIDDPSEFVYNLFVHN